ncbi:MAG: hypothetical protein ABIQ56_05745, partial [Chitinophagaceae bacterium]
MNKIFCSCYLALSVSFLAGCSIKHKMEATDSMVLDSAMAYDPYALENLDSLYYDYDDDAVVITPDVYRPSFTIINDLVHTKMEVSFDWEKRYLYGKAWVTLAPHFYATDSLRLDAKGFEIHKVELVRKTGNIALSYSYDSS